MAGITSLPPEILAQILSYLPRKRDKLRKQEDQEDQDDQIEPVEQDRQGEHPQYQDEHCILCEQEKSNTDPTKHPTKQPFELSVYLPSCAAVCKAWQQQVELQTFREISVMSCELEYLSEIMTESRISALRTLKYSIAMSKDVEIACSKMPEVEKEVNEAIQKASMAAITDVFMLLQDWENDNPLMSLSMKVAHLFSYNDGQREKAMRCGEQWDSIENNVYTLYDRLLHLGPLDNLPKLKSVTRLQVGSGRMHMTEDSMARLATKFPALQILDLQVGYVTWFMEASNWRRELVPELRYRFALSLLELTSLPLTRFSVYCLDEGMDHYSHYELPPSVLNCAAPDIDHLSLAFYAISIIPTMREMEIINFIVSPQIFLPPAIIPTDSEFSYLAKTVPQWPSLTEYTVRFSAIRPSGSWYFVRHPDDPLSDDLVEPLPDTVAYHEGFRTYPNNKAIGAMLSAAGKAKCDMPTLRSLYIFAGMGSDLEFEATWCKSGKTYLADYHGIRIATQPLGMSKEAFLAGDRVYWSTATGRDWRPTRDIEMMWASGANQAWFRRLRYLEDALQEGAVFSRDIELCLCPPS